MNIFSLSKLAPLEEILFDVDRTLCDSGPLHYYAFREMLQEFYGFYGSPIEVRVSSSLLLNYLTGLVEFSDFPFLIYDKNPHNSSMGPWMNRS
ncbi:hypothetical protein UlMin_034985 [Ulmus minor]